MAHLSVEPCTPISFEFGYLQNGEALNINYIDNSLKELDIPLELLLNIHLMRCNSDYQLDCTTPGGLVTDFNAWDRSLSLEELMDWTRVCK